MKEIHCQPSSSNSDAGGNGVSGSITWRCCATLCLVILLFFGLQLLPLAAGNSNQPTQKEEQREPEISTIKEVFSTRIPARERVAAIIQILGRESLQESLSRLDEVQLYIHGAWLYHDDLEHTEIPLHASVGQKDILAIMGNRRFLKIMQELSLLRKEEAASLISRETLSALSEYKSLFDSYMALHARTFESNLNRPAGKKSESLGFLFTVPSGEPTLIAVRFKVLALLLIAGNLQLQHARAPVRNVVETAIEQRDLFYDRDSFGKNVAWIMLTHASLYSRPILATAVLGTYVGSDKAERIVKCNNTVCKSERLTHYNAAVTPYGYSAYWPELGGIDYSKGELIIKHVGPLTDSQFDGVLSAAIAARR